MASRYWVNGTGTWDAAATTHWSAAAPITFTASCSGTTLTTTGSPSLVNGMTVWANNGTSLGTITGGSANTWTVSVGGTYTSQTMSAATTGASVPTSTDDVFFVTESNTGSYTVTTSVGAGANVNNISLTGPVTGALTVATLGSNTLAVYGNYLVTGNVTFNTGSAPVTLRGSTSGLTFDTGNIANSPGIWQNAAGATYTLANNYYAANPASFRLDAGTFNTANNTMSTGGFSFNLSTATTKSFIGGNSTLIATSIAPWGASGDANLTLSVATTNIIFTGTTITFDAGNYTYGNITSNTTALANFTLSNPAGCNISGTLTVGPRAASGLGFINFTHQTGNVRIGNISVLSGTDATMRTKFYSEYALYGIGQTPQVYCNGSVAFTNVDFSYIDARGTSTPWTGNNLGNAGGTSNITFAASKTVYSVATDNANWSSNTYSTTQGGTADPNAFPLPQDTLIFDATHPPTGKTITFNANYFIGNLDTSARTTNSITISASSTNAMTMVGNITLSANTAITGSSSYGPILLAPSAPANITTANITLPGNVSKVGSGNITLNDKLILSNNLQLFSGYIVLNNNIANATTFSSYNTANRGIDFGTSGALNLSGNNTTVWNLVTPQNFGVTGNTNVNLTYSGSTGTRTLVTTPLGIGTFGNDANIPAFNITAGSDTITVSSGNGVRDLNFTGFSGNWTVNSISMYGNLTLSSTMVAPTINSTINFIGGNANLGASRTLTTNGKMGNTGANINYNSGSNVTLTLQDDYAMTSSTTQGVTVTSGNLNLNGKTLTARTFTMVNGGNARNLTFGAGTINVFGSGTAFSANKASNGTVTAGTGTVLMSNATTAKTFAGDGLTFYNLYQTGASNLTITGNNTFNTLGSNVANTAIIFTAGTTTTVTNFSMTGNSGNLITLKSSVTGTKFILSKASGQVGSDYLSISDSNATGGAAWYAGANSANVANNLGWIFSAAPPPSVPGFTMTGGIFIDTTSGGITFSS